MKEFPPFRLDPDNQCLWRGEQRVALRPKSFSVLRYLVEHAGRLVTQQELLDALWPDAFVQPEVLKTHILTIRNVLGDSATSPAFIETQPRCGYRFIARIADGAASRAGLSPDTAEIAASIAVLPFANLSADSDEYFGDGLAEEIINTLARNPDLKVIARTSAFAFKGQNQDIRRIAEALGVVTVLEGSVRKAGSRVRITAQLIRASDGTHLWSGRYDREMTDMFAAQDEISQAIASALQTKLARSAAGQRAPANSEAYHAYLEGRHYMHQVTPQAMDRALDCFERAIALDPGYALPHTGLAFRAYYQVFYLGRRSREVVPGALTSLAKALQLDPRCSEVYLVRGMLAALYDYDWKAADECFARGLELDPHSARVRTGRTLWLLSPTGRLDEALAEIRYAASLDPLSPPVRNTELWVLHNLRRAEAPQRARELLQLFPSHLMIHFVACLTFLARGLVDEAVATVENGLTVVPGHVHLLGLLAFARARQGRSADARAIRAKMETRAATQYVPWCALAWAHEACGDMDSAYQSLDHAIEDREALVVPPLADRREEFHGDPRYRALLRKMNLD